MPFAARIFFAVVMFSGLSASAATPQEAFISELGQRAIRVLADPSYTPVKRHTEFAKILNTNFDLDKIGKFVLGRHIREASSTQFAEYQKLFQKMVVTVYTQRFDNYAGQKFSVKGSTPVDGSENDMLVHSIIEQTGGDAPIDVDWRVRQSGQTMKIIDVVVSGVSMSVTQRSDFDAVIAQSGMDGLLANLRERVASATGTAPAAAKGKKAAAAE